MKRINSASEVSNSAAPRQAAALEESLHRRLASYAIAAGAAGVGVLALAPAAKADIIFTTANINIYASGTYQGGGVVTYALDVDKDGAPDLSFWIHATDASVKLKAFGIGNNNGVLLGPLPAGYVVGPGEGFVQGGTLFAFGISCVTFVGHGLSCGSQMSDPWGEAALGFKFTTGGETHYGYARIVTGWSPHPRPLPGNGANLQPNPVIQAYAYETIANEPITTTLPEPATLGLLALGSLGLGLWRRRKHGVTKSD